MNPIQEIMVILAIMLIIVIVMNLIRYRGYFEPDNKASEVSKQFKLRGKKKREFYKLVIKLKAVVDNSLLKKNLMESSATVNENFEKYLISLGKKVEETIKQHTNDIPVQNAGFVYFQKTLDFLLKIYKK